MIVRCCGKACGWVVDEPSGRWVRLHDHSQRLDRSVELEAAADGRTQAEVVRDRLRTGDHVAMVAHSYPVVALADRRPGSPLAVSCGRHRPVGVTPHELLDAIQTGAIIHRDRSSDAIVPD